MNPDTSGNSWGSSPRSPTHPPPAMNLDTSRHSWGSTPRSPTHPPAVNPETSRYSWGSSHRVSVQPSEPHDGRLSPVADVENSSGNEDEGDAVEKQGVRVPCPIDEHR